MKASPKGILIPIGGNEAKEEMNRLSDEQEQKVDFSSGVLKEIIKEIASPSPVIEVLPHEEVKERDPVYINNLRMHLLSKGSIYDLRKKG